jgi:hypothetical protein
MITYIRRPKSNSDWYEITTEDNKYYEIEIFGANKSKHTSHCMRLLNKNSEEIEVFHIWEMRRISKKYQLPFETQTYIRHTSCQLKDDGWTK